MMSFGPAKYLGQANFGCQPVATFVRSVFHTSSFVASAKKDSRTHTHTFCRLFMQVNSTLLFAGFGFFSISVSPPYSFWYSLTSYNNPGGSLYINFLFNKHFEKQCILMKVDEYTLQKNQFLFNGPFLFLSLFSTEIFENQIMVYILETC